MKNNLFIVIGALGLAATMFIGCTETTETEITNLTDLETNAEAEEVAATVVETHDASDGHTHDDEDDNSHDEDEVTSELAFMDGALAEDITSEDCILSDGTETTCNSITVTGYPANTEAGPFCPPTVDATADEAGIWLDGENMYDADGEFITSLAEIYGDDNWKLYNDDGSVNITETAEAFDAAARPNVDPEYQNHCVEGQLAWLDNGEPIETTVIIPANPVHTDTVTQVGASVGVTFNGVTIDPAAPVDAILGAYTIAAFDDCGGHFNPVAGYHYHASTGCSEVGEVAEGETKAFAVALDGFNIHSPYEADEEPVDLDECNGHTTDELGYHYHANQPEENAVLTCFTGVVEENSASSTGPGGNRPDGPSPTR